MQARGMAWELGMLEKAWGQPELPGAIYRERLVQGWGLEQP